MGVLAIVVAGATLFFIVSMPGNEAFSLHDPVMGILHPFVTLTRLALGDFEIKDYTTWPAMTMFIAVAFFVIVLMCVQLVVPFCGFLIH